MKTNDTCICSLKLNKKPFSKNFDELHCNICGSSRFVINDNESSNHIKDFQYGVSNGKYSDKSYLFGRQLRWSHQILLGQDWTGRKVLEIGCFNGFFLDELKKRGADVYGFDVNEEAVNVGADLFGLTNRLDVSLERIAKLGPFDDVLCIDVLEHLEQPSQLLDEVYKMLKLGGRLTVAGPTVERGFHDKSDFPPHHKWWFSRAGLRSLLLTHEFEVMDMSVQRDGLLFVRNLIGRILSGFRKNEFYGETVVATPSVETKLLSILYPMFSSIGIFVFSLFRLSYCSAIFTAKKSGKNEQ